jgi:hypothetical protein
MAARRADKLLVGSTDGASRLVTAWPEAADPDHEVIDIANQGAG